MEKQITELLNWLLVDTSEGTYFVPTDLVEGAESREQILEILGIQSEVYEMDIISGYGARLSMPGYLDCTEWTVHPSHMEAQLYLQETYEDY